jgi:hypothetical protein
MGPSGRRETNGLTIFDCRLLIADRSVLRNFTKLCHSDPAVAGEESRSASGR